MEKLLKYIINKTRSFMNDTIITDEYQNKSVTTLELFKSSILFSEDLNLIRPGNKKLRVILCANNSINWIIAFLGTIISGNTLIIVSPLLPIEKICHIILINFGNIIVTDNNKLQEKFSGMILNIESLNKSNINLRLSKMYRILFENSMFKEKGDEIIVATPNKMRVHRIYYDDIFLLLSELDSKRIFKKESFHLTYFDFSSNYVFGVLLPLISGTKIVIINKINMPFSIKQSRIYNIQYFVSKYKPKTLVLNATDFTDIFNESKSKSISLREFLKGLKSIRLKSIFLLKKLIIKNRLMEVFPEMEKLIILNSSLSLSTEKFLKKVKFPYTVTYGTTETCGIATYSHPNEFKIESVGRILTGSIIIKDNIIYRRDNINLHDFGQIDENGNIFYICKDTDYDTKSRKVSETLKNIPIILECMVHKSLKDNELPYLLVRPNYEYAEEMKIRSEKELQTLLDKYKLLLDLPFSKVIIWRSEFQKDTNGNIVNV